MSSAMPPSDLMLQRLRELRPILLRFHKALLEAEKTSYEQANGQIRSKGEYFQLVVGHEWFSWLRPISQFVVQMDEVLMSKQPQPPEKAYELMEAARTLLTTSDTGTALKERYQVAIQHDPSIADMYVKISELVEAD
jgi:hypothetical protein